MAAPKLKRFNSPKAARYSLVQLDLVLSCSRRAFIISLCKEFQNSVEALWQQVSIMIYKRDVFVLSNQVLHTVWFTKQLGLSFSHETVDTARKTREAEHMLGGGSKERQTLRGSLQPVQRDE